MIRVTVELVPLGIESMKRTIAVGEIVNDGSGSQTRGNYNAYFSRISKATSSPPQARNGRTGFVTDFPRRSANVWRLLSRALQAANLR